MNRYVQQDEDSQRLPDGMQRIAYDADRSQYTFRDRTGSLYVGEAGSEYGMLTPVLDPAKKVQRERPEAFNDKEGLERYIPHSPRATDAAAPRSFHDMLPSQLITSPTTKPDTPPPGSSKFASFAALISPTSAQTEFGGGITSPTTGTRAAFPRVQGMMQSLKRSVSSAKRKDSPSGRARSSTTSEKAPSLDGWSPYSDEKKDLPTLSKKRSQESFDSMEKK